MEWAKKGFYFTLFNIYLCILPVTWSLNNKSARLYMLFLCVHRFGYTFHKTYVEPSLRNGTWYCCYWCCCCRYCCCLSWTKKSCYYWRFDVGSFYGCHSWSRTNSYQNHYPSYCCCSSLGWGIPAPLLKFHKFVSYHYTHCIGDLR